MGSLTLILYIILVGIQRIIEIGTIESIVYIYWNCWIGHGCLHRLGLAALSLVEVATIRTDSASCIRPYF